MASEQLPFDQAVVRFQGNEVRFDEFINDPVGYLTEGGVPVESVPAFLERLEQEILGYQALGPRVIDLESRADATDTAQTVQDNRLTALENPDPDDPKPYETMAILANSTDANVSLIDGGTPTKIGNFALSATANPANLEIDPTTGTITVLADGTYTLSVYFLLDLTALTKDFSIQFYIYEDLVGTMMTSDAFTAASGDHLSASATATRNITANTVLSIGVAVLNEDATIAAIEKSSLELTMKFDEVTTLANLGNFVD